MPNVKYKWPKPIHIIRIQGSEDPERETMKEE